jgi:hypothetical protein
MVQPVTQPTGVRNLARTGTDENMDNGQSLTWRTVSSSSLSSSPTTHKKSYGIAPHKFHGQKSSSNATSPTKRDRPTPKQELAVTTRVQERASTAELHQKKQLHLSQLATKRAAFKSLTELARWPVQDQAMDHLDRLLRPLQPQTQQQLPTTNTKQSQPLTAVHDAADGDSDAATNLETMTSTAKTTLSIDTNNSSDDESPSSSSEISSSSLSSTANAQLNTKRQMRQLETSPAKSQLKASLRQEFLRDRDTLALVDQDALWNMEPRIFSTEKAQGKRRYLVGHFGRIMDHYWRKMDPKHLYEIIREGVPCRLFFDMEYSIPDNPELARDHNTSDLLLEEFRYELAEELQAEFGSHLQRSLQAADIIDLDSSSDTKFSRHWIVHLPGGYLFPDAVAVGRFVRRLIGRLADDIGTGQLQTRRPVLAQYLFVHTKPRKGEGSQKQQQQHQQQPVTPFVDLGVYTRNRLFRVLGSSKFGKTTPLQISKVNQFPLYVPKNHQQSNNENETRNSNNNIDDSDRPQSPTSSQLSWDDFVAANDWTYHAIAMAQTMIIPLGGMAKSATSKDVKVLMVPDLNGTFGGDTGTILPGSRSNTQHPKRVVLRYPQQPSRAAILHPGGLSSARESTTPLPTLDEYVMTVLATRGGVRGVIRAWSKDDCVRTSGSTRRGSFTYQLCRNRWCELVGRPHKSNNIYWTIDLELWTCIQGCHDPDCHGRGRPMEIPRNVATILEEEYQKWQDEEFERALLTLDLDDIAAGRDSSNNNDSDSDQTNTAASNTVEKSELDNETFHETKVISNSVEADSEKGNNQGDSSVILSDDALLDAIFLNPDLFP